VRLHQLAGLAAPEIGIDDVEVGDLDAAPAGRKLQGQIDGEFRLAGTVTADDRDHAIAGTNDGRVS